MICQQGSHHGHDGKVCERRTVEESDKENFTTTHTGAQIASPGSSNWLTSSQYLKGGFSVQRREARERTQLVRAVTLYRNSGEKRKRT